MKKNERNAGRIPYYGKGVETEILRVLIIKDPETKEKMKADIEAVKAKYKNHVNQKTE